MAVGTGVECINLKKAKYNRNMKLAEVSSVPTEDIYTVRSERSLPKSSARPAYDDGSSFKEILKALAEELLCAVAAYHRKKKKERANAPKYVSKTVKAKTAFPVTIIGYMIVFSVIAMFLVLGNSKINEAIIQGDNLQSMINEEMNRCDILSTQVSSRNDAAAIEDYAVNVLGLVKKTDVAKTYVSISGEDKVVVSSSGSGNFLNGAMATMTLASGN